MSLFLTFSHLLWRLTRQEDKTETGTCERGKDWQKKRKKQKYRDRTEHTWKINMPIKICVQRLDFKKRNINHIIEQHIDLWSPGFKCKIQTLTHTGMQNDATTTFWAELACRCSFKLHMAAPSCLCTSLFVSHAKAISHPCYWTESRGRFAITLSWNIHEFHVQRGALSVKSLSMGWDLNKTKTEERGEAPLAASMQMPSLNYTPAAQRIFEKRKKKEKREKWV